MQVRSARVALGAWVLIGGLVAFGCDSKETVLVTSETESEPAPGPDDPFGDPDGDGLTNQQEFDGWEIAVDFEGYGAESVRSLHVTSDQGASDTDGDGLSDMQEFQLRLDPRSADTDADGLSDHDELFVWLSNPSSVDSDADARGPGASEPPNARLFDGNETRMFCDGDDPNSVCVHLGTSPTLADTDGDGKSDYEELDDVARSPLISDLPQVAIDVVGEIDMRLNVEYEESLGEETQYGTTYTTGTTTVNRTTTNYSNTVGGHVDVAYELAAGAKASIFGPKAKVSKKLTVSGGIHYDRSWGGGTESGTDETEESSTTRFQNESRTMTESTSSGTISLGVELRNSGDFSVEVEDFGLTVLKSTIDGLDVPGPDTFKTLATLTPEFSSVVLAPGEATAPIQVSSTDVNVDVLKEFLAAPSGLVFSPIATKLQAQDGVDFDFLTEETFTRTALVEIDLGSDEPVQVYRVATNVRRGPGGSYEGISMREVLTELLDIPYTTGVRVPDDPTSDRILTGLGGLVNSYPDLVWIVQLTTSDPDATPDLSDFEEIRLHPGDEIRLSLWVDLDQDGLSCTIEEYLGTTEESEDGSDPSDTDGDGMDDREEALEGWLAGWPGGVDPEDGSEPALSLFGYPRLVVSDPRFPDTDGDGLTDPEERDAGTDPAHVDTDRDGLEDGRDCAPLHPGLVLRVDAESPIDGATLPPGTGGTRADWSDAFHSLRDALDTARMLNENVDERKVFDCTDDVVEIWVAQGTYTPDVGADQGLSPQEYVFTLVGDVGVYGGFLGYDPTGLAAPETKLGQRNPDPFSNATVLSGELGDDENVENDSFQLVSLTGESSTLDGFLVTRNSFPGGAAISVIPGGGPEDKSVLRNLLVLDTQGQNAGGLSHSGGNLEIVGCSFVDNLSTTAGGAITSTGGELVLRGTRFERNRSQNGGALHLIGEGAVEIAGCLFTGNVASNSAVDGVGGAIQNGSTSEISGRVVRITGTSFRRNNNIDANDGHRGGAIWNRGEMNLVNCEFWANRSYEDGGAISSSAGFLNAVNCSFSENRSVRHADGIRAGGVLCRAGAVSLTNCVLWRNVSENSVGNPNASELDQLWAFSGSFLEARFCLIQNLAEDSRFRDGTNVSADNSQDPFVDRPSGFLQLDPESGAVDRGDSFVDTDPFTHGIQFLPGLDIDGRLRFRDGNGDGDVAVDMGAHELQP